MAVNVAYIAADHRSNFWIDAPLDVALGERRFKARKWGLTGLLVDAGDAGDIAIGQRVGVSLTLPFQGFTIGFDTAAECDRIDPADQTVTLRFVDLGARERELLKHFVEELVSGSMAPAKDTIQRIDIPLAQASAAKSIATRSSPEEKPVVGRRARALMMTSLYGLGGLLVFGYLGSLFYSKVVWKEIGTAVISAPVDVTAAQFDGEIAWVGFEPGDMVDAGDVVLRITNDELERDINFADIAVRESEAQLEAIKVRRAVEVEKVRNFTALQDLELAQSNSQIAALEDQYKIAKQQFDRFDGLAKRGLTSSLRAEDARRLMLDYRLRLDVLKSDVTAKSTLNDLNRDKRVYAGREVIGDVMPYDEHIALATKQVDLSKQKRDAYLAQKERMAVRSPFTGVVQQLPRQAGSKVRKGEVIAVFEQPAQRGVTAFLQQTDLMSIAVGDKAVISVPAIGQSFDATVETVLPVNYSSDSKLLAPVTNGSHFATDHNASALLKTADGKSLLGTWNLPSGTPVTVHFERKSASRLVKRIEDGLHSIAEAWSGPASGTDVAQLSGNQVK